MATLRIEIELGNEAMQRPGDVATAVAASMVREPQGRDLRPGFWGTIMDENGNSVGKWRVE